MNLGDLAEGDGNSALLSDPPLDDERILVVAQRFVRFVQPLVRHANRVEDVGPLFFVLELNRKREAVVQVFERRLGVAAADCNPPHGEKSIHVLWIARQDFGVFASSLVECAGVFIQTPQVETDVGILGGYLGQILVRFDRLLVVVQNSRVRGGNQVALARRQLLAQLHRPTGGLFRFRILPEVRMGRGQFRIRERKPGVGARGRFESFERLEIVAPSLQLKPVVVVAKSLQ